LSCLTAAESAWKRRRRPFLP